jgi:chromosome segregation ATPase
MTDSEYRRLVEFLGAQFAEIERRLTKIDHRFTEVDHRFTEIDRRFTEIDRRFDETDRRIESLAAREEEHFREILGHFDDLYRRLERLEAEYFAIVQTLRRIETLIGSEQAQRAVLEQSVEALRRQIADLQARLDTVEARLQA